MATQVPTFEEFKKQSATKPGSIPSFEEFKKTVASPAFDESKLGTMDQLKLAGARLMTGGLQTAVEPIAKGVIKEAVGQIFNIGGMIRSIPVLRSGTTIGGLIDKATGPDPLAQIVRAKGTEKPYSMFSQEGQKAIGLKPEGTMQKVGGLGLQVAEMFAPATAISKGAQLLAKVPALMKLGKAGQYAAKAVPEVAAMMGIVKMQNPEEVPLGVPFVAAMGPVYNKALNVIGEKAPLALAKLIPEVRASVRNMFYQALRPTVKNLNFGKAVDRGMPEIYETAQLAGKDIASLPKETFWQDFIGIIRDAKRRIWKPYEKFLGEHLATIDGDDIANAVIKAIPERTAAKQAGAVKELDDYLTAKFRGKRMDLDKAEEYLQNANLELMAHYSKFPREQLAQELTSVAVGGTKAEAEALRKAIFDTVENINVAMEKRGLSKFNVKAVKEGYGALVNLQGEAFRRMNVAMRAAPENLIEQMGALEIAKLGVGATGGVLTANPVAVGNAAAGFAKVMAIKVAVKAMKKANSSEELLRAAFRSFGKEIERLRIGQRVLTGAAAQAGKTEQQKSDDIMQAIRNLPRKTP
jgi:hypothetical protein